MTNVTEAGSNPAAPREALIAQVPMFQLLDADERAALATVMREAGFSRGTVLFHHGDPGDETYIVTSGAIELSVRDKMGQPLVLTTAGHGDIFGELSLLDEGPRTATATATEDSTVLVLERQDLKNFVRRRPDAALDIMAVMARRMRAADEQLQQMAARNVNEEIETRATMLERVTDGIAAYAGSILYLVLHIVWFAAWIAWNLLPGGFDPYPFGFLTLCVSLEAIFLSIIVLLSQNRQVAKDRIRSDIEYEVNMKSELEVSHLHEKVDHLNAAVLSRLQRIETALSKP